MGRSAPGFDASASVSDHSAPSSDASVSVPDHSAPVFDATVSMTDASVSRTDASVSTTDTGHIWTLAGAQEAPAGGGIADSIADNPRGPAGAADARPVMRAPGAARGRRADVAARAGRL